MKFGLWRERWVGIGRNPRIREEMEWGKEQNKKILMEVGGKRVLV